MLDPASEQIQHAKKQRARIYNDNVYFTSNGPPENVPEWMIDPNYIETEGYKDHKVCEEYEYEEYENDNKVNNYDNRGDNERDIESDLTGMDYLLNSTEVNQIWPENLDE